MCVAIPGKVLSVDGNKAVVDFSGNRVDAYLGFLTVEPEEYVLVHAGCVIQKLQKREAEEIIDLMKDMDDAQ